MEYVWLNYMHFILGTIKNHTQEERFFIFKECDLALCILRLWFGSMHFRLWFGCISDYDLNLCISDYDLDLCISREAHWRHNQHNFIFSGLITTLSKQVVDTTDFGKIDRIPLQKRTNQVFKKDPVRSEHFDSKSL